jgi:putative acyl-CoA dehydrogenase
MSNQSPIHAGHNAFDSDGVLLELTKALPKGLLDGFSTQGKWVASAEALDLARLSNENTPVLRTHNAKGDRIDVVEFHPAYHALMRRGVSAGLHASIWDEGEEEQGNRNLARAVRFISWNVATHAR